MDWAKTIAKQDKKHLSFGFGVIYTRGLVFLYTGWASVATVLPIGLQMFHTLPFDHDCLEISISDVRASEATCGIHMDYCVLSWSLI